MADNNVMTKAEKNEYQRKWAAAHPEKVKALKASYYAANKEELNAKAAIYRANNKEKIRAADAKYCAANREKARVRASAWYAANKERAKAANITWAANNPGKIKEHKAKYAANNQEKTRASSKRWNDAHPEVRKVIMQNRRARVQKNGGKLSTDLVQKLLKLQRGKCACCGKPLGNDYHLDHRMPIALGGANEDSNMQLLTAKCNLQKWKKHPVDFMQEKGFLL